MIHAIQLTTNHLNLQGNKKNKAQSLTLAEQRAVMEAQDLNTPRGLQTVLWFRFGSLWCQRGVTPHREMTLGDLQVKKMIDGREYVE